jgi:hypothetical protein
MAKNGRKSLSREKRLKSAKTWLAAYRGKNVVRGYRKWFGVSDVCAIVELRLLGVDIPDARLEQARRNERDRAAHNARRKQKWARPETFRESDETFAFIAGYTEGGAPYGVTWEEMEALEARAEMPPDPFRTLFGGNARDVPLVNGIPVMDDDDSLPF